jgi:hypothetical protein
MEQNSSHLQITSSKLNVARVAKARTVNVISECIDNVFKVAEMDAAITKIIIDVKKALFTVKNKITYQYKGEG